MATTVDGAFREFVGRLTPALNESEAAQRHRASIEARLTSSLGMTNFFRSGSFGNGTSIRGYSDVDYFAVFPPENLAQDSNLVLRRVRAAMLNRFPLTNVRVRSPAVVVPFGTSRSEVTEIVPAFWADTHNGFPVYGIPNGTGGWMRSSPTAHKRLVAYLDEQLSGKLRPLIRFLKAWKYFRQVPISSFFLELRAAVYFTGRTTVEHSSDLSSLFVMQTHMVQPVEDPMGISGWIFPYVAKQDERPIAAKARAAAQIATNASLAESRGQTRLALRRWSALFGSRFPFSD